MRKLTVALVLVVCLLAATSLGAEESTWTLSQCVEKALANNRQRPISKLALEIAEAQHGQATSAYWPQIGARSTLVRLDDDPVTIFPEETAKYTILDLLPQPIEATVTVPEKEIKLMDRTHWVTAGDMILPLYIGGRRGGMLKQTRAGMEAARQEVRRTDLQVVYDTKRFYYGSVLARNLEQIGDGVLARLEVTLDLTESLYKRGSGKVKKTDYLKHKVAVESLRSLLATLRSGRSLAEAALVNTMGMTWDTPIVLADSEIPFSPYEGDLRDLVGSSYRFSPDWARLEAGLDAADGRIKEARSGHMPRLALLGQVQVLANPYDAGIVGPSETKSWRVGISMELPLFDGFLTRNRVREARARLKTLEQQKVLLREGLALKVKYLFLRLSRTQEQEKSAGEALKAAEDNRELNARAYQSDLVELEDVVEAQITEALMKAQYQMVRYDHYEARAQLENVIGAELRTLLGNEL